jgi:hypothetical protein
MNVFFQVIRKEFIRVSPLKIVPNIIALIVFLCFTTTYAQRNHKTITWSSLLFEIKQSKLIFTTEAENSHSVLIRQQDYFTTLLNTEFDFSSFQAGLGVSYWIFYDKNGMLIPEWRPHEQIRVEMKKKKFTLSTRARLEQRFTRDTLNQALLKTFVFSWRPRLLFQLEYPLIKTEKENKKLDLVLSEEIATTIKMNGETNSESRLYVGLWYQLNRIVSVRAGYLWLCAQDVAVNNSDIFYFTLKFGLRTKSGK